MKMRFDLNLYSLDALYQAIQDYKALATIKTDVSDKECICEIVNTKYNAKETCNEFANYVLELTVNEGLLL